MRRIQVKVKNPNIVLSKLTNECIKKCSIEDGVLIYKLEEEYTYQDKNLNHFFITLASYIYSEYVLNHLKDKKLSNKELSEYTAISTWMLILIVLKIEQFFQFNDLLDENIFFRFNLASLGKDIDNMYEIQESKKQQKKDIKIIRNQIKKSGLIDINDYKTVFIDYDSELGIIIYSQKDNEYLTLENIHQKLGISIKVQETDQWQIDLNFCLNCLLILNVKKIIIYEDMFELIEDLKKNPLFLEMKVKVEVM